MSKPVRAAAAGLALSVLAGAALAQTSPAAPAAPTAPRWTKTPSMAQLRAARPKDGGARVAIRCHVDPTGALSACVALSETPAGSGYAQAFTALAPEFRMDPGAILTEAPDGTVTLTDDTFRYDTPPSWLKKPSPSDLMGVWPKAAFAKGIGGRATINCLINLQGALYDCVTLSETPAGANFGAAAIALTPQLLMKPATLQGQPIVAAVNVPIYFAKPPGGGGREGDIGGQTVSVAMAWSQAPSYADMAAAYPRKAREAALAGHATVNCGFTSSGGLIDCVTISEAPKGEGFGDAAHRLARQFRLAPELLGKAITRTNIQVPFAFDPAVLGADKPAIGKPQWVGLPNAADTAAAFGEVTKSVSGTVRVMLACTVQPGGGVADCKVAREDPAGHGVGAAALSLAPHFQLTTWTTEGLPVVGGTVNIPLRYEGGKDPAPAPAAKP